MASRSSNEINEVQKAVRTTGPFVKHKKDDNQQQQQVKQENIQPQQEQVTKESNNNNNNNNNNNKSKKDSTGGTSRDIIGAAYRPPSPPARRRVPSGSTKNPNPIVLGREALAQDSDSLHSPPPSPNLPSTSPLPRLSAVPSASARAAAATRGPSILKPPRGQRKRDKYVPSFVLNFLNRYVKGRHRRGPFRSKSKVKWANGFPIIKIFQSEPIIETQNTTPPSKDRIPVYDPYIGAPGVVPYHPSSASIPSTPGSYGLGTALNEGSAAALKKKPLQKYSSLLADVPFDIPTHSSSKVRSPRATGPTPAVRHAATANTSTKNSPLPKLAEKPIGQPTASGQRKGEFLDKGGSEKQDKHGGAENKP
ncbi:hypothetical protein AA313_de0200143 [Arthrobotrys entomopaga]|nr:hypothetical protein AA313_de0200143 [Arthrobotrys entomopaga]